MWAEARKQEKRIKGMMVDLKKRAERRKDFYEKIKADPVQFLQVHGRSGKINLDPFVAQAAEHPQNMMPLMGDTSNMIDRFDARSHLDFITEYKPPKTLESINMDEVIEERRCNYERYRLLVHLDALEIKETQHLQQIKLEESYPEVRLYEEEKKKLAEEKRKKKQKTAAIGYTYEDDDTKDSEFQIFPPKIPNQQNGAKAKKGAISQTLSEEDTSDEDQDDDLNVTGVDAKFNLELLSIHDIQRLGTKSSDYGILPIDFIQMVDKEKADKVMLRLNKEMEEEKAMFAGKKARRERRLLRDQRVRNRRMTPPSYATRQSPSYDPYRKDVEGRLALAPKSPSPAYSNHEGTITYITSFGGDAAEDGPEGAPALPGTTRDGRGKSNHPAFAPSTKVSSTTHATQDKSAFVGPTIPAHILSSNLARRSGGSFGRNITGQATSRVMGVVRNERYRGRSRNRDSRSRRRSPSRHRSRRRSRSSRDDRTPRRYHRSSRDRREDTDRRRDRHGKRRRHSSKHRSISRDHRRRRSSRSRSRKGGRARQSRDRRVSRDSRGAPGQAEKVDFRATAGDVGVVKDLATNATQSSEADREVLADGLNGQATSTAPIQAVGPPLLAHPFQKIVYEDADDRTDNRPLDIALVVTNFKPNPATATGHRSSRATRTTRYRRSSLSSTSSLSIDSENPDSDAHDATVNPGNGEKMVSGETSGSGSRSSSSSSLGTRVSRRDSHPSGYPDKYGSSTDPKKLTPLEKMKRQTALALAKIQKEDRKAQVQRVEKQEQERMDREEELRLLTLRIRRRERDRRHRDMGFSHSSSGSRSKSKSPFASYPLTVGARKPSMSDQPYLRSRSRSGGSSPSTTSP